MRLREDSGRMFFTIFGKKTKARRAGTRGVWTGWKDEASKKREKLQSGVLGCEHKKSSYRVWWKITIVWTRLQ